MPPAQWMNDPNGPVYWKGHYHLFYQHNPGATEWGNMHWGHAMSKDLIHWEHLPIALAPDPEGPDFKGVFSGTALVDGDCVRLIYFGNPHGICIATSSDDNLVQWTKHPANPTTPQPKHGEEYIVYDPCMWKVGDTYLLYRAAEPRRTATRLSCSAQVTSNAGNICILFTNRVRILMTWAKIVLYADAPHPDEAHEFIDFLMRADIAARNANYVHQATVNAAALPMIDPALRNDPGVYPPAEVLARLVPLRARTQQESRLENSAWTSFKSGP